VIRQIMVCALCAAAVVMPAAAQTMSYADAIDRRLRLLPLGIA
jgi:hypothetical protein